MAWSSLIPTLSWAHPPTDDIKINTEYYKVVRAAHLSVQPSHPHPLRGSSHHGPNSPHSETSPVFFTQKTHNIGNSDSRPVRSSSSIITAVCLFHPPLLTGCCCDWHRLGLDRVRQRKWQPPTEFDHYEHTWRWNVYEYHCNGISGGDDEMNDSATNPGLVLHWVHASLVSHSKMRIVPIL